MGLFKKKQDNTQDINLQDNELDMAVAQTQEAVEPAQEATEDTGEADIEPEDQQDTETESKGGFFSKLAAGLSKTRDNLMGGVTQAIGAFKTIDEELYEELEEALIMADMGVETSLDIIEKLRGNVKEKRLSDPAQVKTEIQEIIQSFLQEETGGEAALKTPTVILVIGVNGAGKTTTIGKLANRYKQEGKKVLLAAADTFRAAAIDQLEVWAERSGCALIKQQEGSDPGAVVYDACNAAKARGIDVLICDTAGRLHNKKNLMDELAKINKIINGQFPEATKEIFIVLDATAGQNSLQQVKLFKEVCDISGIVLTKLDGTAKGGIVVAIGHELKVPVKFIGVGEGLNDLQPFNPQDFAKALFLS